MEKTTFTRQELYDLVWSEPLLRLSKKYNISDNGLRKNCKRMNIPLPGNGYWMKLKYNKPVGRKKLPKDFTGTDEINLYERDEHNSIINPALSRKKALLKSYETLDQRIFKVPVRLSNPDKMIIKVQKNLTSQRTSEFSRWLVNSYSGELDIKVSKANVGRALRIFDAIIKLLRFRGHDVIISGKGSCAMVEGEKIEIALREKLRIEKTKDKNDWNTYKYHPTDKLIFKIGWLYIKEFQDNKSLLEDKLPAILAELEYRGQKEKEEREEREIRLAKEREEQRLAKERQERKEKELKNFRNLLKESNSWHQSVILENYIKEVENRAIKNNILTDELQAWFKWAKQKAEWFNPFIKKDDEYFSEDDRFLF